MRQLRALFAVAFGLLAAAIPAARAQDLVAPPDGTEVLARGPINEAYATAVSSTPAAGPLCPKAPPDPIEETPPSERPDGENVTWMPETAQRRVRS